MEPFVQATLKKPIELEGVGLHSGRSAFIRICPAPADHGVCFVRQDVAGRDNRIPALFSQVVDTELSTRICNSSGVGVSTVEHLMAALSGTGIFNALIEIEGPEVPILDGSAEVFVQEILRTGVRQLAAPIRAIRVLEEVSVSIDDVFVSLAPSNWLEIFFQIEFEAEAIGKQVKSLNMANGTFVREVCYSRTFCNWSDVEKIRLSGQGLGGSLENTNVIDGASLLNPEGFRHVDECVRHKILDALGDLALAGAPIFGRYAGIRAGHKATNLLLRALFARPDAWELVVCDDAMSNEVPGVHIKPEDMHRSWQVQSSP